MIRKGKASSFLFVIVDRALDSSRLCYFFSSSSPSVLATDLFAP